MHTWLYHLRNYIFGFVESDLVSELSAISDIKQNFRDNIWNITDISTEKNINSASTPSVKISTNRNNQLFEWFPTKSRSQSDKLNLTANWTNRSDELLSTTKWFNQPDKQLPVTHVTKPTAFTEHDYVNISQNNPQIMSTISLGADLLNNASTSAISLNGNTVSSYSILTELTRLQNQPKDANKMSSRTNTAANNNSQKPLVTSSESSSMTSVVVSIFDKSRLCPLGLNCNSQVSEGRDKSPVRVH